jgi:hypothetical protein
MATAFCRSLPTGYRLGRGGGRQLRALRQPLALAALRHPFPRGGNGRASPGRRAEALGDLLHAALDLLQRRHHLGDALARDVLEGTGLVDPRHRLADPGRRCRGQFGEQPLQGLAGVEDLVGGGGGMLHHRIQLVGRHRDVLGLDLLHPQGGDLGLGLGDGAPQRLQLRQQHDLVGGDVAAHAGKDAAHGLLDAFLVRHPASPWRSSRAASRR